MKQHTPILDLELHNARFRSSLVNHIKKVIAELPPGGNDRQFVEMTTEQRTAALTALANHVGAIEIADARLFQLAEVARAAPGMTGWLHRQDFQPSVTQRQILGSLGRGGEVKDLDRVVGMLISGGVADVLRAHSAHYTDLRRRTDEAIAAREAAEQKVEPLTQTEADLAAAQSRIANLEAEIALRERQLSEAQSFLTAPGSDRPRRVHVTGETGIYTGLVDGETRLEVGYPDDQGKQRWKRLSRGASIEDARRLRERLAGQPHDPEHGGSTDDDAAPEAPEPSQDAGAGDDDQPTKPEPVAAGQEA
jgi:hypothetical protein